MKTVYIPKGETVSYETLETERLVVKGCLKVAYGIKAKTISGSGGIYIQLSQFGLDRENVLLYRSVQSISDYTGGQNNFVTLNVLQRAYYPWLLDTLSAVRKERARYGWAA